jgi:hypothetical protein
MIEKQLESKLSKILEEVRSHIDLSPDDFETAMDMCIDGIETLIKELEENE